MTNADTEGEERRAKCRSDTRPWTTLGRDTGLRTGKGTDYDPRVIYKRETYLLITVKGSFM